MPYTVGVTIDEFAPKPVGLLVGEGDVRARGIGGCGRAERAGDDAPLAVSMIAAAIRPRVGGFWWVVLMRIS